jgi:hypothetical protein
MAYCFGRQLAEGFRAMTAEDAVRAIRHVVQKHGDAGTRLGGPADRDALDWFGRLLGWHWPPSYLDVLARHDGVVVQDAIVFGFLESVGRFLTLHGLWHRPAGFWPVASDGGGNYYALALGRRDAAGECPVVFFEILASAEQPECTVAENFADFLFDHMTLQCRREGCSGQPG